MSSPTLAVKMRALADEGHPLASSLRYHADVFSAAWSIFMDPNREVLLNVESPDAANMLGAWRDAREVYNEASGEDLDAGSNPSDLT